MSNRRVDYTRLFDSKADIYAAARPRYPPALYTFLTRHCAETERAWDCACGNGQSAISLAPFFSEVQATDISENQIRNAFSHPRINYFVCPSEETPFGTNSFDLVSVAQALHWMEYARFWPEVKRVLKPGGIFSAWGYCWTEISSEVDHAVQNAFLDIINPYWAEQNKLLWNHYRDVEIPFERIETPTFEMTVDWDLNRLFAYLHSWSATRRCMNAVGENFFHEAYNRVLSVWGNASEVKRVKLDFCCVVAKNEA